MPEFNGQQSIKEYNVYMMGEKMSLEMKNSSQNVKSKKDSIVIRRVAGARNSQLQRSGAIQYHRGKVTVKACRKTSSWRPGTADTL